MVEISKGASQIIKVFNQMNNIGEVHYFDLEGKEIGYNHFTIKDGKEIFIDPPPNEERTLFFIPPANLDSSKQAQIVALESGKHVQNALALKRIEVGKKEFLTYLHDDKLESRISVLSQEEKRYLFDRLIQEGKQIITIQDEHQIRIESKDIDLCGFAQKSLTVFKNIERQSEIGICQLIADQMYHLSDLLRESEIQRERKDSQNFYIKASKKLTTGELRFIFPFTATDLDSARKIALGLQERMLGLWKKMWVACWSIGYDLNQQIFTASLNKIMTECYPGRKSRFSDEERREFLDELRLLRIPQFTLIKRTKVKKRNNEDRILESKFHISILRVEAEKGDRGSPPSEIMINLLSIVPMPFKSEKKRFVGVPIKRNTLEARGKQINLELFLQTRKHQDRARKKDPPKFYDFKRSQLIGEADLIGTDASNSRTANKRLLEKLEECRKKGHISSFPKKVEKVMRIFW